MAKRERRRGEERRGRWRGEGRVKLLGQVWEGTLTLQEDACGICSLAKIGPHTLGQVLDVHLGLFHC